MPASSSASATVTVTAGQDDGSFPVTFTAKTASGDTLPGATLTADVAKPGEMWPYYNNTGISTDGQAVGSGFDGSGYLYSANALAAMGLTPGAVVTSGGVTYTWPDGPAGQPDNVVAAGQTIPVTFTAGTSTIGLLGSASKAGSSGAAGTLTVTYTDATTQQIPVAFSDWTLRAGAGKLLPGDTIIAQTPYRNTTAGSSQNVTTFVYATTAALRPGKTVASVTLPTVTSGTLHVFAIGTG